MTKKKKKELSNICQICGVKAELEAAHKKGLSGNNIIENILSKYYIAEEQTIKINLEKVEKEIIGAHSPIKSISFSYVQNAIKSMIRDLRGHIIIENINITFSR
jgi:iron-sulfur cluster repair protein YtfE (RIC family)